MALKAGKAERSNGVARRISAEQPREPSPALSGRARASCVRAALSSAGREGVPQGAAVEGRGSGYAAPVNEAAVSGNAWKALYPHTELPGLHRDWTAQWTSTMRSGSEIKQDGNGKDERQANSSSGLEPGKAKKALVSDTKFQGLQTAQKSK